MEEKELLKLIQKEGWSYVSNIYNISEDFMRKYNQYFDAECWSGVSNKNDLSLDFLDEFKDKLNWISITDNYKGINDDFVERFKDYICWEFIPGNLNVSEKLIDKYHDKIDWNYLNKSYNSYPIIDDESNKRIIKFINKYIRER